MSAKQVPHGAWTAFFESFSRSHEGWLSALGDQTEYRPLRAISGGRIAGEYAISIQLDNDAPCFVRKPIHVWVDTTVAGADEGFHIESADGTMTRLRFRSPATLASLDGVVLTQHERW